MIDPYKGVRDFYPEDERIQNYIFAAMRRAVESFGYEEMNASILESTDLYRAKTSEEIVNEQTYTFMDRGDRSVTLRPEMTPTVARMVAARKRELPYPLRWYSIQNFFRYERPQKGRLREFWQLNVDLFGVSDAVADVEVLTTAHRVMMELGAKDSDFTMKIAHRGFLNFAYDQAGIPEAERAPLTRLLDAGKPLPEAVQAALADTAAFPYFTELLAALSARGIANAVIDTTIARGFDYYTGVVFEVFDTNPENRRSMFGGGRYDTLVEKYGSEPVPAVGFAMGDVIARDFLETHNLLPQVLPRAQLYLAPMGAADAAHAADTLRANGVRVALGMKHDKVGDHIKAALKLGVPYFAVWGEDEQASGTLKLKNLATQGEESVALVDVPHKL